MRKIKNELLFESKRMLNIEEAAGYVGIGQSKARAWLVDIGAKRKFGGRVLYDKVVIDDVLNRLANISA